MNYIFSTATQALMLSGKAVQVAHKTGILLPIARCLVTGRFLEVAKPPSSTNPLIFPTQLIFGALQGYQTYQTHTGFKNVRSDIQGTQNSINTGVANIREDIGGVKEDIKNVQIGVDTVIDQVAGIKYNIKGMSDGITAIQHNLGVLQATTALIGVGTIANVAISAASLHQILKLREDVRQMRVEIRDGFIDLKKALKDQGAEILNHIDEVAADIKFEQHRVVLIHAYSQFLAATKLIQQSLLTDPHIRDQGLASARHLLSVALADYRNNQLLSETSALGKLRRMECAWAIEQTIIMTYQIQKQSGAVTQGLKSLQVSIRQDIVDVSNAVQSQEEIDLLYPEISRICTQDLVVLSSWQEQSEWIQSLPASDLKLLESSELSPVPQEMTSALSNFEVPEQKIYDELKPKSHFESLRDQLKLMASPDLRSKYEYEVVEKAQASGHKALKADVVKQSSDMAIANLYYYFQF
ncbi:hypothetical protein [Pseudanabaena sp. UWO311]|uniref:hypothetical protein n=1 Tax=Pseudanabaena sp. UWO311 TaxID=2487337 RepID=UPI001CC202EA|nr:hypothetical protein [Pseudanabaena sp. UWO311]